MKRWQSTGNWVKSVSYSSISYASVECKCLVFLLYRDCTAHTVYTFSLNEAKRIESLNCSLVNLINNYIGFPFHLIPVICMLRLHSMHFSVAWMNANESNVLCRLSINDYGIRFVLRSLQLFICVVNLRKRSSLPWNAQWIKTWKSYCPTRQEWNTVLYAIDS